MNTFFLFGSAATTKNQQQRTSERNSTPPSDSWRALPRETMTRVRIFSAIEIRRAWFCVWQLNSMAEWCFRKRAPSEELRFDVKSHQVTDERRSEGTFVTSNVVRGKGRRKLRKTSRKSVMRCDDDEKANSRWTWKARKAQSPSKAIWKLHNSTVAALFKGRMRLGDCFLWPRWREKKGNEKRALHQAPKGT